MTKLIDILRALVGEMRCRLFDWRHHVHTCGNVELEELTITSENMHHGVFYEPTHPKLLFEVLSSLDISYERYALVDLGSGKGRVLLVASEFPFLEVRGVEFARELHECARENIRQYRSGAQKTRNVWSIHGDAIELEFPTSPFVLFLNNPFGPAVLVPILRRLRQTLTIHPRDVIIVYATPRYGDLIERETMLTCVERSRYHNTYRTRRPTDTRACSAVSATVPQYQMRKAYSTTSGVDPPQVDPRSASPRRTTKR